MNALLLSQRIQGNQNVALQNIHDSVVNITLVGEEFKRVVENLETFFSKENESHTLKIIVLTATKEQIKANPEFANLNIQDSLQNIYGDAPHEWKPFGYQSIEEILRDFAVSSKIDLEVRYCAMTVLNLSSSEKTRFKRTMINEVILLVDPIALFIQENQELASLFNVENPGGLVVVLSGVFSPIQEKIHNLNRKVYEDLYNNYYEIFDLPCISLELEVPNVHMLKRRLSNIAIKHLEKRPWRIGFFEGMPSSISKRESLNSLSHTIRPK